MATIRQYFETDFSHVVKVEVNLPVEGEGDIEAVWLVDFLGYMSFFSCYVPGESRKLHFFLRLIRALEYGETQLGFRQNIRLPQAKLFPGELRIENKNPLGIHAHFFGDVGDISASAVPMSRRVFIYSETQLNEHDLGQLKGEADRLGHELQFRSEVYAKRRSLFEKPLAFVSYDSRDREVAQRIATGLQRMMCPVWYDQFSLKVGANLRDSIERGLKECRKCVLVLSDNFLSNKGWTKREFDSVFTREILEEKHLVLPIWHGVGKQQVFDYSLSLLNVKGINWAEVSEQEVCRQLYLSIEADEPEPSGSQPAAE
jgi:hypothetical protein